MFTRKTLLLSILLILPTSSFSQDTTTTPSERWILSLLSNLTLTINSYSDNWAGDEYSAFSWNSQVTASAQRALFSWLASNNTLKLAFGQTAIQVEDTAGQKEWQSLKKSVDLVDFESVAQFTLQSFVDPFVSVRAVTQFVDMRSADYDYYLNPLTLTESFGALRNIVKNDRISWSVRLGGAVRQSIERNDVLPDSLKPADDFTNDGGVELVTELKATTGEERLKFISQLKVFEALVSSKADRYAGTERVDYWRYPDVFWENTLGVSLVKYVSLNLYAQLLYDKEVDSDVRYRQTTGLTLTYSFEN